MYSNVETIAVDTEGSVENPWGLSFSPTIGTAFVVKAADAYKVKDRLERAHVVCHNALHDIRVLAAMGININTSQLDDTMLESYLQPWLPRGLKPLSFKICGLDMASYEEVISGASDKVAKEYLEKVLSKTCAACQGRGTVFVPYKRQPTKFREQKCPQCGGDCTAWPKPDSRLVFNEDGAGRLYKPRGTGRAVRSILERGTDFKARWDALSSEIRTHPETELGKLREATLDDVPLETAVAYSGIDAAATLIVHSTLAPILKKEGLWNVYEIDKGIIPIIDRMHTNGILIDREHFRRLDERFTAEQTQVIDRLSALAGTSINPSSPLQVGNLLYNKFGLKPPRGQSGTDEKTLETLKLQYKNPTVTSIIDLITDYRELAKLKGTYVDTLPLAADAYDRVHTQFLLHVTNSGRLSSRDPNLQNIPTRSERGREIRKGFIARPGCVLVSVDLDQIELRVAAHLSEDDNMVDVFRSGKDIHRATASLVYKIPMEEVTTQQRLLSKTINFGILYGMSAKRLMRELNLLGIRVTLDDCIGFINDWFAAYPGIKDYMERCHKQAKEMGYVECLFGRRRYLPGVYSTLDKIREESLRWSVNHPDQGTAAGILKLWLKRVNDTVIPEVARYGYCEPLLTVHDEIIFEVEEALAQLLSTLVVAEAEQTMELLVPIKAKGGYGHTWNDLK